MDSLMDLQVEIVRKFEDFRKNYAEHVKEIKGIASNIFGDLKVYVFGSILEKPHPMSDVDVAIVLPRETGEEDRIKFYREVRKKFGLLHPFEIHIITKNEWENWYRRFVKNFLEL